MSKNWQVTYVMSGAAHLPYLVCSVWTLRRFWGGKIEIQCWPESGELARHLESDGRLGVQVSQHEPIVRKSGGYGGNSQFIDKIHLTTGLDCGVSLYLDADTTVHGKLDPLFEAADEVGFAATQFNDWTTQNHFVQDRLKGLLDIEGIPDKWIDMALNNTWPSVNGGVWAAAPGSVVLDQWLEWTKACKSLFISDERVLHLMPGVFPKEFAIFCQFGKYNTSPIYQSNHLEDKDVVVRHYHGDSNLRPNKSAKGFGLWWPIYLECLDQNVGQIQDWIGQIDNKHLNRIRKDFDDETVGM